jgi:hypothetical protein
MKEDEGKKKNLVIREERISLTMELAEFSPNEIQ